MALALAGAGYAQSISPDLLEDMKFRNIGPAGMSGRVTSIDVNPLNDNHIFVGTASGGVWVSENAGQSWTSIWDDQPTAGIGAVKIDPTNPDVIWVGTGEGNPRNSQSSGGGLFKSVDGGKSFQLVGLKETKHIHRIVIDPRNPNTAYVAAIGVAWGDSPHRGVYKTTDGGKTWSKVLYNNERSGAADLVMDPVNPNKLICAMWEYRRWPWIFKSGGEGSGMYVTLDGGETWTKRTSEDGLPEGELGRMGIAIAPGNPKKVYALIENKAKNGCTAPTMVDSSGSKSAKTRTSATAPSTIRTSLWIPSTTKPFTPFGRSFPKAPMEVKHGELPHPTPKSTRTTTPFG